MCRERRRTRDRLLEYDSFIMPYHPRQAGLSMVYPWENMNLSMLQKQIYQIALNEGFQESEQIFWSRFSQGNIIFGTLDTFPIDGDEKALYFDTNTESLYYFKRTTTFNEEASALLGVAIANRALIETNGTEEYCLYIPLKAYLMEDIILDIDGGSSIEIID